MKLWLLTRDEDDHWYDENCGHVIAATDEGHARRIAMLKPCDEGPEVWKTAKCVMIGDAAPGIEAGVLLTDNMGS